MNREKRADPSSVNILENPTVLTNADIRTALGRLTEAITRADKALGASDDLPCLDLAEVMVETSKLSTKLGKLADKVERLSAPLFGPNGQGGAEQSEKPAGGRRKRK